MMKRFVRSAQSLVNGWNSELLVIDTDTDTDIDLPSMVRKTFTSSGEYAVRDDSSAYMQL
jgi:hypothetical protein